MSKSDLGNFPVVRRTVMEMTKSRLHRSDCENVSYCIYPREITGLKKVELFGLKLEQGKAVYKCATTICCVYAAMQEKSVSAYILFQV